MKYKDNIYTTPNSRTKPSGSTIFERTIFFLILGVAFYMLDRWSFYFSDDYLYAYKFGTYEPILNLGDIWESQRDHYMNQNGRFIAHFVVQLFCGMWGIQIFQIFHSAMFVALCALTTRLFYKSWQAPILWYLNSAICFGIFMPSTNMIFFGNISCGINYLWVAVATAYFFLVLEQNQKENSLPKNILFFIFGFFCGSLQESFSIPIAGALGIYYLFNLKKLKGSIAYLVIGYWIGSILCICAPGNILRFLTVMDSGGEGSSIGHRILVLFNSLWFLALLLGGMIIYNWVSKKINITEEIKEHKMILLMLTIEFVFCVVVMCVGGHQLFFAAWLMVYLFIKQLLHHAGFINKYSIVFLSAFIVAVCPVYISAHKTMRQTYEGRMRLIQSIECSLDGYIPISDWNNCQVAKNRVLRRFLDVREEVLIDYVSTYYTGNPNFIKGFVPYPLNELQDKLKTAEIVEDGIVYLRDAMCYVVITDNNEPFNVEATYERGASKILYSLKNRPTTFTKTLTKREIRHSISDANYTYHFFYVVGGDAHLLGLKKIGYNKAVPPTDIL